MIAYSESVKIVIAFIAFAAFILCSVLLLIMVVNNWLETRETEAHRQTIADWNLVDRLKKESENDESQSGRLTDEPS